MKKINALLPLISAAAAVAVAFGVPDSSLHQKSAHPYFSYLVIIVTVIYYAGALIGNAVNKKKKKKPENPLFYRALFLAGVILFFNILISLFNRFFSKASINYNGNY